MTITEDPSSDDERTARAHMVLSALAIGLMGLALFLGYELTRPAEVVAGRSCTVETAEEICQSDEACVDGSCKYLVEHQPRPRCQENDPCDVCECSGKFKCGEDNLCKPLEVDVCSSEVLKVLADTRRFEREQCRATGKTASNCEAKDLDAFFMRHQDFNELMRGIQHRTTAHFDNGVPSVGGLSATDEKWYRASFASVKQRMIDARHILIIGRASQDSASNQSVNYSLAQQRMILVQKWVVELGRTPLGQSEMEKKLITLAIGTSSPLAPEDLATQDYHHFITWSKRATDRLQNEVRRHSSLSTKKRESLLRQINQSVLVVPIHCEIPDDPAEEQP